MKIRFSGGGAVWLFAYGSLMWDPGFAFVESRRARLWGYHRRFCVESLVYRGTPEAPGLVLGLDRGGSCTGIAFRIAAADRAAAARYLEERELAEDIYRCREVTLAIDRRRVPGHAFVVDRANRFYAGVLDLETQAGRIAACRGARGSNLDYLLQTASRLEALGLADRSIDALTARIGGGGGRRRPPGPQARAAPDADLLGARGAGTPGLFSPAKPSGRMAARRRPPAEPGPPPMPQPAIRSRRSFIFTPGLRPDMFPKALSSGADMVCVELEDGIAPRDKEEARRRALALFEQPQVDDGIERLLRINSMRERFGIEDVQAILAARTPPPALMMPKIRTPDEVAILDQLLTEAGHDTRLHVIIETAAGLEAACEIARASGRIETILFGGVDMAAELRCRNAWEPLLHARSRVVHAAAGAGIDAIDVPYLDLDDPDGLRAEAERARDLGFAGKGAVHPKQIAPINEAFTPSGDRIAHARRVVAEFEAADTGLLVIDGKLIEKPVLREMYRIAAIADRTGG